MHWKKLIKQSVNHEALPPFEGRILQITNLRKTYRSAEKTVDAFNDISLTIKKKDVYGIIGRSGAGKSTLLRCIATLIRPTSGKILFDGFDLSQLHRAELQQFRRQIGMIFQHFNLLSSRTTAGNIAYPLEITHLSKEKQEERVDELLELVDLSTKKHIYPALLSGGEKQRVGIARALANHPNLLLCDEATSALDPKTTREILTLLRMINEKLGLTIILITHEMSVVKEICNRVAVIENGRVIEQGLVSEVFARPHHPTTQQFLGGGIS